jgi:hypothetical protein
MKTRTIAAAAIAAVHLAGCSAEFAPVSLYSICAPPAPDSTTGACLYPATCDANFAGIPLLDPLTAQVDFRLPFQVNNSLVDNSSTVNGRINTNNALITSFELTYTGAALQPITVPASIRVPTAGSSGALITLIPVAYFPAIVPPGAATTTIQVNVRGHGILDSQASFTTAWFQVPVEVCGDQCLAGDFCPGQILASCPGAGIGATSPGQSANFICIAPAQ